MCRFSHRIPMALYAPKKLVCFSCRFGVHDIPGLGTHLSDIRWPDQMRAGQDTAPPNGISDYNVAELILPVRNQSN